MVLDFTTTAVARPRIVNRTYNSFTKNLKGVEFDKCTLFINIDPAPAGVDRKNVVKVAKKYFGKVVPNLPKTPSFTGAYNWCWSSAKTRFIFNLEDDWKLLEPINIKQLVSFFDKHKQLYEVALRAYPRKYNKCALSPALLHRRFYHKVGGKLDTKLNPECQLRGRAFGLRLPSPESGIPANGKVVAFPSKVVLADLGREWLKKQPLKKPKKKAHFTSWV